MLSNTDTILATKVVNFINSIMKIALYFSKKNLKPYTLAQKNIDAMHWTSQSPDLNPSQEEN